MFHRPSILTVKQGSCQPRASFEHWALKASNRGPGRHEVEILRSQELHLATGCRLCLKLQSQSHVLLLRNKQLMCEQDAATTTTTASLLLIIPPPSPPPLLLLLLLRFSSYISYSYSYSLILVTGHLCSYCI